MKNQYKTILAVLVITLMIGSVFGSALSANNNDTSTKIVDSLSQKYAIKIKQEDTTIEFNTRSFEMSPATISSDLSQMSYQISFPEDKLTFKTLKGYDIIELPEETFLKEVGSPMLPIVIIHLIIPPDKDIKRVKTDLIDVYHFPGTYKIFPTQPPIPTQAGITSTKFVEPNKNIYRSNEVFPGETIKVIDTGFFDGANHIVSLELCPFRYYPLKESLEFIATMELQLELAASQDAPLYRSFRYEYGQRIYDSFLQNLVDNPNEIPLYRNHPEILEQIDNYKIHNQYIIITNEILASAFEPLCEWRRNQGIPAEIVLLSTIENCYPGVDTQEKIRNFLIDEYAHGALDFVLLGGDETVVPIRYAYPYDTNSNKTLKQQQITDLYYADFTGDWEVDGDGIWGERTHDNPDIYPEVFIGRIPANTTEEVENFVLKLLIYEKNPGEGNLDYLTKALWICADGMRDYGQHYEEAAVFPSYFTTDTSSCEEQPSGSDPCPTGPYGYEVINVMNQNWQFINILNHGNPDNYKCLSGRGEEGVCDPVGSYVWGDREGPPIQNHSGAITDLSITSCFSITYSISCYSGYLDLETFPWNRRDKCFGEVGLLLPLKSDVAFLGNSRVGWVHCSYLLQKKFYEYIFDPISPDFGLCIGMLESLSKTNYPNYRDLNYGHNLWGDPVMHVWSRRPSCFDLSTIGRIKEGPASITIRTGVSGSLVCMRWPSQGYYKIGVADDNGEVTFETNFTNLSNTSPDILSYIVTHANYIPYEGEIPIYNDDVLVIHDLQLVPPPGNYFWYPIEGGALKYQAKIFNGYGFNIPAQQWYINHNFYQESECGNLTDPPVLEVTTLGDRDLTSEEERCITFALKPLPCGSNLHNGHTGVITIGTSNQDTDTWCFTFYVFRGECESEEIYPNWVATRLFQVLSIEINN